MRNLIEFLSKYNHWFVFLLLEAFSLVLLFQYNSYQASAWFSSANFVAGKVYEWSSKVESYFALAAVNRKLTDQNTMLSQQADRLTQQLIDATKDSAAVAQSKTVLPGYKLIAAQVVSNRLDHHDNLLTIDKGTADGVRPDMGVVSGMGIVGVVYLASEHYAVVMPILNSKSAVSCIIQGRGYFGTLTWNGGPTDKAYLDDVPRHAKFRRGDKVVTSGYSSIFPPGIVAGTIQRVFNSANGMAYRLEVKLSTDFGRLRDVNVIDNSLMEERIELMRAAEDSLKTKQE